MGSSGEEVSKNRQQGKHLSLTSILSLTLMRVGDDDDNDDGSRDDDDGDEKHYQYFK